MVMVDLDRIVVDHHVLSGNSKASRTDIVNHNHYIDLQMDNSYIVVEDSMIEEHRT